MVRAALVTIFVVGLVSLAVVLVTMPAREDPVHVTRELAADPGAAVPEGSALEIPADEPSWVPDAARVEVGLRSSDLPIGMGARRITGLVVLPRGLPLDEEVEVKVFASIHFGTEDFDVWRTSVVVEPGGEFTLDVPRESSLLCLDVDSPSLWLPDMLTCTPGDEIVLRPRLRLEKKRVAQARVLDFSGDVLNGARNYFLKDFEEEHATITGVVEWQGEGSLPGARVIARALRDGPTVVVRADEDGAFEIEGLVEGEEYVMSVWLEDEESPREGLDDRVVAPSQGIVIPIRPAAIVRGRVEDIAGQPVQAVVWSHHRTLEVGEDGRFELRSRPGRVALRALTPDGRASRVAELEVLPGEELEDVVLEVEVGSATLSVVVDVPYLELSASVEYLTEGGSSCGPFHHLAPDDFVDGRFLLEGLPPGRVVVIAFGLGADGEVLRDEVELELASGASEQVLLELSR